MNDLSFLSIPVPEEVRREIVLGNFKGAERIIKRLLKRDIPAEYRLRLEYELERMKRMKKDFPLGREDALKLLRENIKNFKDEELEYWISKGYVDRTIIDGEEKYFANFLPNLFFWDDKIKKREKKRDERTLYSRKLVNESVNRINSGDVRKYRIVAGIKIKIKKRGNFRVWLPVPKENFQIEKVKILSTSHSKYYLADNNVPQRTIYFEDSSKEFYVEFEYTISEVKGGIEGDADIMKNLKEKPPHVRFTPTIMSLAKKITEGLEGDYERARAIYNWITRNVNYTYVKEYCLYDNISEFMATSLHGDCGVFALLFITLCREIGIPAKWQSGWFITPKFASPHDWAQVYIDGKWLPVDASFGNARRHGKKRNDFYFGNLDAFRMIANDDFMVEFDPEKKHWHSDPVDNQRGEVETERRNLYFNEFETKLYVKSFKQV